MYRAKEFLFYQAFHGLGQVKPSFELSFAYLHVLWLLHQSGHSAVTYVSAQMIDTVELLYYRHLRIKFFACNSGSPLREVPL